MKHPRCFFTAGRSPAAVLVDLPAVPESVESRAVQMRVFRWKNAFRVGHRTICVFAALIERQAFMTKRIDVYLECGPKRIFAGALDWPGCCRAGRDESAALAAPFEHGRKYARVLSGTRLGFAPPEDLRQLVAEERLEGDATTDFGAPGIPASADTDPLCSAAEIARFEEDVEGILRQRSSMPKNTFEASPKRFAKNR
jgi:hypothetical protein